MSEDPVLKWRSEREAHRQTGTSVGRALPSGWRLWPWSKEIWFTHDPADPPDLVTIMSSERIGFRKWRRLTIGKWYWEHTPFAVLPICGWIDEHLYTREWPEGSLRLRMVIWSGRVWPHIVSDW